MPPISNTSNFQRPDNSENPLLCLPDEVKLEISNYFTSWPDFLAFRQTCIDSHRISEDRHGLLRKFTQAIHKDSTPIGNSRIDNFGACCESFLSYATSPFFNLLKHLGIKVPTPDQHLQFTGFKGNWTNEPRSWDDICFTSNMINIMFLLRKTFTNPDFPRFPASTPLLEQEESEPALVFPYFFNNPTTAAQVSDNLRICPFRLNLETSGLFETRQAIKLLIRRFNSLAREAVNRVEFLDNMYNFENPAVIIPPIYPTQFAKAQKEKASLERFDLLARKIVRGLSTAESCITMAEDVISPTLNQLLASWIIPWIGLFWIADRPESEPKQLHSVATRIRKLDSTSWGHYSNIWRDWSNGLNLLTVRI
ncbi:hypothetical protein BJ508DRAFT_316427, partial [Ascobolus immersus RN42]